MVIIFCGSSQVPGQHKRAFSVNLEQQWKAVILTNRFNILLGELGFSFPEYACVTDSENMPIIFYHVQRT